MPPESRLFFHFDRIVLLLPGAALEPCVPPGDVSGFTDLGIALRKSDTVVSTCGKLRGCRQDGQALDLYGFAILT
jgi:hypothetical protein